eukprot:evm.model.scf_1777.1 EVM.evm.TU.scf_1777.1   scf_1777:6663-10292(-)
MAVDSESIAPKEVNWERLDKWKFFVYGTGIFSGVTTCLYPLSVIKTRQMATSGLPPGFQGAKQVAAELWRSEGIRAFYKGFGTVCIGTIPGRMVYMSTLEIMKSVTSTVLQHWHWSAAGTAGGANFVGGLCASLMAQCISVPIDVASQRLMVLNNPTGGVSAPGGRAPQRMNGLLMAQLILRQEGARGLYRGFMASILTYVPNSAIWWSAYGVYQSLVWRHLAWLEEFQEDALVTGQTPQEPMDACLEAGLAGPLLETDDLQTGGSTGRAGAQPVAGSVGPAGTGALPASGSGARVVAVQMGSAALAGVTAAIVTTPIDVIKTRLQLSVSKDGRKPTMAGTVQMIFKEEGARGFLRGIVPRTANVALWGTCMVTAYEFLKRICALPEETDS